MPEIKIRIEKASENSSDKKSSDNQLVKNKNSKSDVALTTIFAQQMISYAKQTLSYTVSNIGNFTGNYMQQDLLESQLELFESIGTVALGFIAKGPVGGTIAIAGVVTKKVFETISNFRSEQLAERDLTLLQKRSGNSTTNSSRGTEN